MERAGGRLVGGVRLVRLGLAVRGDFHALSGSTVALVLSMAGHVSTS